MAHVRTIHLALAGRYSSTAGLDVLAHALPHIAGLQNANASRKGILGLR